MLLSFRNRTGRWAIELLLLIMLIMQKENGLYMMSIVLWTANIVSQLQIDGFDFYCMYFLVQLRIF
jgi:hypothetical protein